MKFIFQELTDESTATDGTLHTSVKPLSTFEFAPNAYDEDFEAKIDELQMKYGARETINMELEFSEGVTLDMTSDLTKINTSIKSITYTLKPLEG